jgi:two-component system, chemotaxis family, protein-glutamate methylesterase/glutaminase
MIMPETEATTVGLTMPIVALVCSTGGLDAVERILGALPDEFPAAVLVLRHHDPHGYNWLAQMLRRKTRLPVASARDGDRLEAGRVLVAPAGHHTLVTDNDGVALIQSGDRPPYRPSADLLLTSLAITAGRRTIAVVLSGYGNDGATGATAVHRFGGVVVASDEATSTVFAMPYATISRDHVIDYIAPVDEIASLLVKLTTEMASA